MIHLQMKNVVNDSIKSIQNQNFHSYNRIELAEKYLKLSKVPPISELFAKIKLKCGNDTAHIIIDEFNLESLDNLQADNLNEMFNKAEWEPSVIMILPQSLEKEHLVISQSIEVSRSETTAYRRINGMVTFTLSQHMRSTISNFNFNNISTVIIAAEVKNSINHSKPVILEDETSIETIEASNSTTLQTVMEHKPSVDVQTNKIIGESATLKNDSLAPLSENEKEEPSFLMPVNLDELQEYETSSNNPNRTDTIYSCRKCNTVGHDVKGKKPKFIYFQQIIDDQNESISKLTMVLKKLLFFHNCKTLWLCKYSNEFKLCAKILKLLDQNFINYHPLSGYQLLDGEGNKLEELPLEYNVLTDNKGARGLECRKVVIFIPSAISNEQQTFLETISRCTSELFIVYSSTFNISFPALIPPVIHQIMSEAVRNDLIQECVISGCVEDDTDDAIIQSTVDGKECFHINHESREYKKLNGMVDQLNHVDVCANDSYASP